MRSSVRTRLNRGQSREDDAGLEARAVRDTTRHQQRVAPGIPGAGTAKLGGGRGGCIHTIADARRSRAERGRSCKKPLTERRDWH